MIPNIFKECNSIYIYMSETDIINMNNVDFVCVTKSMTR